MQQREQRRIEEEIKQLRKLQGNKKCADCKSLSNPYVCSDYNTFVCTRCAGIHRELGHRVKSVTAEIFTKEEVAALKRYGNAKHNAIYLATWRESDFPEPAADDNKRIHKWFEEKYIRRRWYRDPSSVSSNDNNYNNATAESYQQQPPPQQLQQQQQQQQFQQQPQQPQQMNNQGGWGSAPAWGAPAANQQPVQPNNAFNPFPGANMNAPANNTTSVNASFNVNVWGATAPAATTASVNNNNAFQPQRPQQPAQQSSADMLGLFMSTTTTSSAPAPAPVNNGFGGFGTTTTTTNNANNMNTGMNMNMNMGMGMGMNTQPQPQSQPAFQSNVGLTTTMNPNRAQPLSRGQSNNPFASLVDIAPAVPSSSAPTSTNSIMGGGMTMTATTSSSAGNNNALDSLFSSAPQGQSAQAPVAQRTNNLIDF